MFYKDIGFLWFRFKMFGLFGGVGMWRLNIGVYFFRFLLKVFMIIEESFVVFDLG